MEIDSRLSPIQEKRQKLKISHSLGIGLPYRTIPVLLTYIQGGAILTSPQPDLSGSGNTPVTGQADHGAIIMITQHYLYMVVHYGLCLYNFTDSPIRTVPDAPIFFPFPALRAVL